MYLRYSSHGKTFTKATATWAPNMDLGSAVTIGANGANVKILKSSLELSAEKAFLGPSKILFCSLTKIPTNEILRQCMPKKLDDLSVDLSLTAKLFKPVSSWLLWPQPQNHEWTRNQALQFYVVLCSVADIVGAHHMLCCLSHVFPKKRQLLGVNLHGIIPGGASGPPMAAVITNHAKLEPKIGRAS